MTRIVLVLNHHAAPSETFQRMLAVGLADAGYDVVVHGLLGDAPPDGDLHPAVRYSSGLPAANDRGHLVSELARRRGAGAHLTARLAIERFGRTARAARAAAQAGPILEQRPDAAADLDTAVRRLGNSRQYFQQRRFAGTVLPDDTESLALVDRK